jgi:hypothetical protein
MAYNNRNKLKEWKIIQNIVQENYIEGVTTYKGIWRTYVNPDYPMCYATFLKIINTPIKSSELEPTNNE